VAFLYLRSSLEEKRYARRALKELRLNDSGHVNRVAISLSNSNVAYFLALWAAVDVVAVYIGLPRSISIYFLLAILSYPTSRAIRANILFRRLRRATNESWDC